MKQYLTILLSIVLCIGGVFAADLHKEINVASGKTLQVNLDTGGEITITGWEKDVVSVDVYFKGRDDKKCRVDIDETSSGVSIASRYTGRGRNHSTSLRFDCTEKRLCGIMPPFGDMKGGLARITSAYSFQRSSLASESYSWICGLTKPCKYRLTSESRTISGEMS